MRRDKEKLTNTIIGRDAGDDTLIIPISKLDLKPPSLYKVLLHNDDYTPMDFVIEVLENVFHKANALATKIMLDVHQKGLGLCGVYPYEIAETKVTLVIDRAKQHQYPLKCTMEEA